MKPFNQIISEVFKIDESAVSDALTAKDIPAWDSMNYIMLIAELEKNFNISFSMDEVMSIESIGDMRRVVEERSR